MLCSNCQQEKEETEFYFSKHNAKRGRTYWCKSCTAARSARGRHENPEKGREYSRQYNKTHKKEAKAHRKRINWRNTRIVQMYLHNHPCVDCGNSDVRVLEFDHVRGEKRDEVTKSKRHAWRLRTLLEEIKKCDVRCANCHRIRHAELRNQRVIDISDHLYPVGLFAVFE